MYNFKNKKVVGKLGEDVACIFLERRGFHVLERNYLKKWGEIDIIAIKDNILTFIEVKSVVDDITSFRYRQDTANHAYRPEEKVHIQKRRRLSRTIQTYLAQKKLSSDTPFVFHIAVIHINTEKYRAHVTIINNVIL